jgi:hypothetical protein
MRVTVYAIQRLMVCVTIPVLLLLAYMPSRMLPACLLTSPYGVGIDVTMLFNAETSAIGATNAVYVPVIPCRSHMTVMSLASFKY